MVYCLTGDCQGMLTSLSNLQTQTDSTSLVFEIQSLSYHTWHHPMHELLDYDTNGFTPCKTFSYNVYVIKDIMVVEE